MKTTRKRSIEPLDPPECQQLIRATGRGYIGFRDRAAIYLLWQGQLRVTELVLLRQADFDPVMKSVNVTRGKGGKQRIVALTQAAVLHVAEWIGVKAARGINCPLLFCTLKGHRMCRHNIGRMLKTVRRKAGLTKRIHPHSLRHSGARHLSMQGIPVALISAQLGHSNISTTSIYLESLAPAERLERIGGVSW
jgi:integrase/recombinase XerD